MTKNAMLLTAKLNDRELIRKIEDCTLPASDFTHGVILKMAWILINRFGLKEAMHKIDELKRGFYKTVLKNEHYNPALSMAYAEIVYHFMEKSSCNDFGKLLGEFPRLKYDFKGLLSTHYGYDILKPRKEVPMSRRPILFNF